MENLNLRLARLLAEYSASQAKLKQRIAKLETRSVITRRHQARTKKYWGFKSHQT